MRFSQAPPGLQAQLSQIIQDKCWPVWCGIDIAADPPANCRWVQAARRYVVPYGEAAGDARLREHTELYAAASSRAEFDALQTLCKQTGQLSRKHRAPDGVFPVRRSVYQRLCMVAADRTAFKKLMEANLSAAAIKQLKSMEEASLEQFEQVCGITRDRAVWLVTGKSIETGEDTAKDSLRLAYKPRLTPISCRGLRSLLALQVCRVSQRTSLGPLRTALHRLQKEQRKKATKPKKVLCSLGVKKQVRFLEWHAESQGWSKKHGTRAICVQVIIELDGVSLVVPPFKATVSEGVLTASCKGAELGVSNSSIVKLVVVQHNYTSVAKHAKARAVYKVLLQVSLSTRYA